MEDFAGAEEGEERPDIALEFNFANDAAQAHPGSLTGRISFPIIPVEVAFHLADGRRPFDQAAEVPGRRIASAVEII